MLWESGDDLGREVQFCNERAEMLNSALWGCARSFAVR